MIRFIFLHYYVNVISTGEGDRDPPNDPISSHSHPITNTSSKSKPKANILCFDDRSTDLAVTLDRRRLEYQSFLPLPVSVVLSVCSSNKQFPAFLFSSRVEIYTNCSGIRKKRFFVWGQSFVCKEREQGNVSIVFLAGSIKKNDRHNI